MRYRLLLLLIFCPVVLAGPGASDPASPWPAEAEDAFELFTIDGYRLYRYRSPPPKQSDYATTLDTPALQKLLQQQPKPVLIDVQPITWNGVFIEKEPRQHLPGSIWLPNVGQGELAELWQEYFRKNLSAASGGDKGYPLVLYCTADCWMSWNAIKRAASWGYHNLYWYRTGTDGWAEFDLPTEQGHPEPFPP